MNKQERKAKIKLAKNLYEKYKFAKQQAREFKFKIVKISDEVCDTMYGGQGREIYTLEQFALDVGVNIDYITEVERGV